MTGDGFITIYVKAPVELTDTGVVETATISYSGSATTILVTMKYFERRYAMHNSTSNFMRGLNEASTSNSVYANTTQETRAIRDWQPAQNPDVEPKVDSKHKKRV